MIDGQPLAAISEDNSDPSDDNFDLAEELDDVATDDLDKLRLDGVPLALVGPIEPDEVRTQRLAVLDALQLTPGVLQEDDKQQRQMKEDVQAFVTPRLPRAVVLGCGVGGTLLAIRPTMDVEAVVDPDWQSLECLRCNRWHGAAELVRASFDTEECRLAVVEARPEIILGNACGHYDPTSLDSTAA